ncbi:hypothetical protein ACP4OV_003947 [Aristida adscensionis]
MVKIVDIEGQPDADHDDDCYEIDPAEFAKKVNLKESDDDLVLVAAKGRIVKVEVDQPEQLAKTSDGYGSGASCLRNCSSGDADDNRHAFAAGDCIDNPYKIDEDEMNILNLEIHEDRFVIDKLPAKSEADDHSDDQFFQGGKDEGSCDAITVISDKLVVKPEPVDHEVIPDKVVKCGSGNNSVQADKMLKCGSGNKSVQAAADEYDHCLEMAPQRRVFDEEDDEDVVVV